MGRCSRTSTASFSHGFSFVMLPLIMTVVLVFAASSASGALVQLFSTGIVPIQPSIGAFATPCTAATLNTTCKSGAVRLLAAQRFHKARFAAAAGTTVRQISVGRVDETKLTMQHPLGLGVNALLWQRMQAIMGTEEDGSIFTVETQLGRERADALLNQLGPLGIRFVLSNFASSSSSRWINTGILWKYVIVEVDSTTRIALLALSDPNTGSTQRFDPVELADVIDRIRKVEKATMVVALFTFTKTADYSGWKTFASLGVDLVVLPPAYYGSTNQTAHVTREYNLTVVYHQYTADNVVAIDIDTDKFKASNTAAVNVSETLLSAENAPAYLDTDTPADITWAKKVFQDAESSDPVIGSASAIMPPGWDAAANSADCQWHACPLGTFVGEAFLKFTPEPADVAIINAGGLRAGWPVGTLTLGQLYSAYPFSDVLCIMTLRGQHLWKMLNHSATRAAAGPEGAKGTPFGQTAGVRYEFNMDIAVTPTTTRLTNVEVYNKTSGAWEVLRREAWYRVVTSTYICNGGNEYPSAVYFPGENISYTGQTIHRALVQFLGLPDNTPYAAPINGGGNPVKTTKTFLMKIVNQEDCPADTFYSADMLNCVACPAGFEQKSAGQSACVASPIKAAGTAAWVIAVPVVISCVAFILIIAGFAFFIHRQRSRVQVMASVPRGMVSIAFTDIQGSTELLDRHPMAMQVAMQIHDRIMRHEIGQQHGFEVKTIGDAFMVAFSSSAQAVAWCVNVQRALCREAWPEPLLCHPLCQTVEVGDMRVYNGLRVRMGVHTAVMEPSVVRSGLGLVVDYLGMGVNIAARVQGQAQGGQILISQDTHADLTNSGHMWDSWVVTPAGVRKLKGVGTAVQVFSVLPEEFRGRIFAEVHDMKCQRCMRAIFCPACDNVHFTPAALRRSKHSTGRQSVLSTSIQYDQE